jgi:hypothetical protein
MIGDAAQAVVDHAASREQLKAVNRLFMEEPRCSLERIQPALTAFLAALRCDMDQQEDRLFPAIKDRATPNEVLRWEQPLNASALTETMTVQEVARRYPDTNAVLEGLGIDRRFEGYDGLDEVAWRHGMESQALLALLEEAVRRPPPRIPQEPLARVRTAAAASAARRWPCGAPVLQES